MIMTPKASQYPPEVPSLHRSRHRFSLCQDNSINISRQKEQSSVAYFNGIKLIIIIQKEPWTSSEPVTSVLAIFDSGSSASERDCFRFFWTSRCGFTCYGEQSQPEDSNEQLDGRIKTFQQRKKVG